MTRAQAERAKSQAARSLAAAQAKQQRLEHEDLVNSRRDRQRLNHIHAAFENRQASVQAIDMARQEVFDERRDIRNEHRLDHEWRETQAYGDAKNFECQQAQRVARAARQRNAAREAVEHVKQTNTSESRRQEREFLAECREQAFAERDVQQRRAGTAAAGRENAVRNVKSARADVRPSAALTPSRRSAAPVPSASCLTCCRPSTLRALQVHRARGRSASEQRQRARIDERESIPRAKELLLASHGAMARDVHEKLSPEKIALMRQREVDRKRALTDRMKAAHLQTELRVSQVRRQDSDRRQAMHDAIVQQRFEPKFKSSVAAKQPSLRTLEASLHQTRVDTHEHEARMHREPHPLDEAYAAEDNAAEDNADEAYAAHVEEPRTMPRVAAAEHGMHEWHEEARHYEAEQAYHQAPLPDQLEHERHSERAGDDDMGAAMALLASVAGVRITR